MVKPKKVTVKELERWLKEVLKRAAAHNRHCSKMFKKWLEERK